MKNRYNYTVHSITYYTSRGCGAIVMNIVLIISLDPFNNCKFPSFDSIDANNLTLCIILIIWGFFIDGRLSLKSDGCHS